MSQVPVIALPPLVVVAQDTFTVHHEGQSVFEGVLTLGTGVGRCHGTISKKGFSSITYRAGLFDRSAFMLLRITTATRIVNQSNARLTNPPMKMHALLAPRGNIATFIDVSPGAGCHIDQTWTAVFPMLPDRSHQRISGSPGLHSFSGSTFPLTPSARAG